MCVFIKQILYIIKVVFAVVVGVILCGRAPTTSQSFRETAEPEDFEAVKFGENSLLLVAYAVLPVQRRKAPAEQSER